jgi:hypothetical protein
MHPIENKRFLNLLTHFLCPLVWSQLYLSFPIVFLFLSSILDTFTYFLFSFHLCSQSYQPTLAPSAIPLTLLANGNTVFSTTCDSSTQFKQMNDFSSDVLGIQTNLVLCTSRQQCIDVADNKMKRNIAKSFEIISADCTFMDSTAVP